MSGPGGSGRRGSPLLVVAVIVAAVLVIGGIGTLLVRGFMAAGPQAYEPTGGEIEIMISGDGGQPLDDVDVEDLERVLGNRLDRAGLALTGLESGEDTHYVLVDDGASSSDLAEAAAALEGLVTAEFRAVLAIAGPGENIRAGESEAIESGELELLADLDCQGGRGTTTSGSGDGLLLCGNDGEIAYLVGPEEFSSAGLDTVDFAADGPTIDVAFNADGAAAFEEFTARLADQTPPENQMALLVDGEVVSAPAVAQPITGSHASLTGFSVEEGRLIASQLDLAIQGVEVAVVGQV